MPYSECKIDRLEVAARLMSGAERHATGTIGVEVAKALSASKHEVVRASRNGEFRVNLEDSASIRAMFNKILDVDAVISCAGNAAFRRSST